jgi:hypothetical protein
MQNNNSDRPKTGLSAGGWIILVLGTFALCVLIVMVLSYKLYKDPYHIMITAYNKVFDRIIKSGTAPGDSGSGTPSGDSASGVPSGDSGSDTPSGDSGSGVPSGDSTWKEVEQTSFNADRYFDEQGSRQLKLGLITSAVMLTPMIRRFGKWLGPKFAKTVFGKRVGALAIKLSTNAMQKLGLKAGAEVLGKIGAKIGTKLATNLAVKAGVKAGIKAFNAALSMSVVLAPIGIAFEALQWVAMGLDMADVGGYMKMATVEMYTAVRQDIWDNFKKTLEENQMEYPLIYGPLDHISVMDQQKFIDEQTAIITSITSNPDEPLVAQLMAAIKQYILDHPDSSAADLDAYVSDNFEKLVDMDAVLEKTNRQMCANHNGRFMEDKKRCTYSNPIDCKNSMTWPPTDDTQEPYVEWDKDLQACVIASSAMYTKCKDDGLGYNWGNRMCDVTEEYCLSKGAKWQDGDCRIPKDQEVFEAIFGTTVTRGLIQIFDANQYCPCPAGTTESPPYLCNKCPDHHPQNIGALCYKPCPEGYVTSGFGCRKPCPGDGRFSETLLTCTKDSFPAKLKPCSNWSPNYRDDGTSCWLDTYPNGVGTIPEKSPCKAGQRDDGTSCWEDWSCNTYCDWNWNWDDGGYCHTRCSGCGCIKQALWERSYCPGDKVRIAGLCYNPCRPGYHFVGGNLCEPDGGPGIRVTLGERQYCPSGYTNVAGICWAQCPDGFPDFGVGCSRPGYERVATIDDPMGGPVPMNEVITKKRRIAFSTKDGTAITSGNCS